MTFGRVLREVGIEVGPGRVADAVRGLGAVELTRQDDVYFTLRQTLVSRQDELELFDRAFVAWFLRGPVAPLVRQKQRRRFADRVVRDTLESGTDGDEADESVDAAGARRVGARAPPREGLRRDDARGVRARPTAHGGDRAHAAARQSRRRTPDPRGDRLDLRRLCRKSLRSGGEPIEQSWKARKTVPRKLVVLCDISGSMDAYARALLFYLHAIVGTGHGVEAFAFGTRLTRLTPDLATRDPEAALARANQIAVDWGSGTRIGGSLAEFNTIYGRRALSRGAVVVIVSDGWERDDPDLVGSRDGEARSCRVRGRLGQPAEGQSRVPAARRRNAGGAPVR